MEQRGVVGILVGVVALAAILLSARSRPPGTEARPSGEVAAPPSDRPERPSEARRALTPIPVADDPSAPESSEDDLTADDRERVRRGAEAAIAGAIELCLGPWAHDIGLATEPIMVRVAATTTEAGLVELRARAPDGVPHAVDECLYDTISSLPWPTLPRPGEFEQTWRFTAVPGDGSVTRSEIEARVAEATRELVVP